jgi:tight adherence protein C
MSDLALLLVPALSFMAVAAVVLVLGRQYATYVKIQRRLPAAPHMPGLAIGAPPEGLQAFIVRHFDAKRFGFDVAARDKLRRELIKAGYFGPYAVNDYIFLRLAAVIVLPLLVYVPTVLFGPAMPTLLRIGLVSAAVLIAIAAPDAWLARRQRLLAQRYRQIFPDMLDLLVVCVDAGLGLDAAFERIRGEIAKQSRALGMNLELMGAETRAGRSMIEALESLADRLGLEEAGSFVTMLRQSIELGSDVGDALRVFSDDMRDKRLLRAEEAANKLSVKIVLPLGLFIFPVVLMVIMLPVVVRLMAVLGPG